MAVLLRPMPRGVGRGRNTARGSRMPTGARTLNSSASRTRCPRTHQRLCWSRRDLNVASGLPTSAHATGD
eukprot:5569957-Lingulodinium_polyedra.AAC.1